MDKMLSVKDIQASLGCGKSTVYEIIATGTLPCMKIGRRYYIPEQGYKDWIQNHMNSQVRLHPGNRKRRGR